MRYLHKQHNPYKGFLYISKQPTYILNMRAGGYSYRPLA